MRWFKRSARDHVLRDISLGRKGQASGSDAKKTGGKAIFAIIIIIVLIFGGAFLYGFLASEGGQRTIATSFERARSIVLDPFSGSIEAAQRAGAGNFLGTNVNTSSRRKGLDLLAFSAVTPTVFAGESFDLQYQIDFANTENDRIDTTFYCYMNATPTGGEERTITGSIIPQPTLQLQRGIDVDCRINGAETTDLDGAFVVRGWFDFNSKTEDATLPVYLIPENVADQLNPKDLFNDFVSTYDLDITPSDLQVTYNGEPVQVAIGTGAGIGNNQPVIVRGPATPSPNTLTIDLSNEWRGDIVELESVEVLLPTGITIDEELARETPASCPFQRTGDFRGTTVYTMSEDAKDRLFRLYFSQSAPQIASDFFGTANQHRFVCKLNIEEDLFAGAPFKRVEYTVSADYKYRVKEQIDAVSIIGTEEEIVTETIIA